jgi:hypothetical protein
MATQLIVPPRSVDRRPFLVALARLTSDECLAIHRSGGFTRRECSLWAANYSEEVPWSPLVNDEFEWIALRLADLD